MKRTFFVAARWDSEANVYYSDSDIHGLHIEASNLDEFESLVIELAPDLIIENHLSAEDLATTRRQGLSRKMAVAGRQDNSCASKSDRAGTQRTEYSRALGVKSGFDQTFGNV